ncbi:MAG: S41 family peptidase [Mucilaginibacter sp.]|uniref:S41 family peptidase n=1 Tax=Mucilaginibacter sp. TaxID=1882438 RepID=UPI0031A8BEC6
MKLLKKALMVGLLFIASQVNAQVDTTYSPSRAYPQSELLEDFTVFKNALIELHPSLYRYQKKAAIDSIFAKAASQINKPMTEMEFWRLLKPVIVSIRSGHTELSFSSAAVFWQNKHRENYLPPIFKTQDNELFMLTRDKGINRVFKVKSINGLAASRLLDTLKQYTCPEGMSNQWLNFQLQYGGFSYVYAKVLGNKPAYEVVATDSLNVEKKSMFKGVTSPINYSADKLWQLWEAEKDELNKAVAVNYPSDIAATAVLKIRNFSYYNYHSSFHDNFFKLIQQDKIKNLVIDIRGNTGGVSNVGLDLMSYLVNHPFAQIEWMQMPTTKITLNDYILKASGDNLNLKSTDNVENYSYRLTRSGDSYPVAKYHFDKRVYVLIDKGTFSAASMFATSLKKQRKITLVGEETGGAEAGTDGGLCIIQLPHSKLLLGVPPYWEYTVTSHQHSTHGLMPDVPVNPDIMATGKGDKVMKKVKELILAEKH